MKKRKAGDPDLIDRRDLLCALFPMGLKNLDFQLTAQDVFDTIMSVGSGKKASDFPIESLNLSTRTYNALKYYAKQVKTVEDLLKLAPNIMQVRGIGPQCCMDIENCLRDFMKSMPANAAEKGDT